MAAAATYYKVARNALVTDLEYRSNYYILILSSFITVAMEIAVFRQVYSRNETAGDLHASQAASFIVLGMLVRTGSVVWSLVREMIDEIRDGSFRRYLLQPIHFPSFFLARLIGPKGLTWTLCLITILSLKSFFGFATLLPAGTVGPFLVALTLSYAFTWSLYLMMVYLGFFFEEAGFLMSAFNIGIGFFAGSILPLSWLPPAVRAVVDWTPFPLLGDYPIRAGLGTLTAAEFQSYTLQAVIWLAVMLALNAWLRRASFKAYEAYGG